jgi:hypothetical protein
MVAKTRDLDPRLFACLDQRHCAIDLNLLIVDDHLPQVAHVLSRYLGAVALALIS